MRPLYSPYIAAVDRSGVGGVRAVLAHLEKGLYSFWERGYVSNYSGS